MSPVVAFAVPDDLVRLIQEMIVDGSLTALVLGSYFLFKHFPYLAGKRIGDAYLFNFVIAAGGNEHQFRCIGIPLVVVERAVGSDVIAEGSPAVVGRNFQPDHFGHIHFNDHAFDLDDLLVFG